MVAAADFHSIYEYNWRVLRDYCDALSKLPREDLLKNREATYNSMKNIFFHILSVHAGRLNVTAQGGSADPKVHEMDFDDIESMATIRVYMEKIIAKEERFLTSLNDIDLE